MTLFEDFQGRKIRLTDERLAHILSHHDPSVHIYHKWFAKTSVTRKYLIVAVKYIEDDAFIITSFFTDKEKKGTQIWPQ